MAYLNIKTDNSESSLGIEMHQCQARRENGWIIYTCPKCPNYERRIHPVTREMQVSNPDQSTALHAGSYSEHELDHAFKHSN